LCAVYWEIRQDETLAPEVVTGTLFDQRGKNMKTLKKSKNQDQVYASCEYLFFHKILDSDFVYFAGNKERTLYCKSGYFEIEGHRLNSGDSVEIKNQKITIYGSGKIYVAEVESKDSDSFIKITRNGCHYRVNKPWGYELWVNGDHPLYSFKVIGVGAGTRTSLQYHRYKEETTLIDEGDAILVYKSNDDVSNDDVTEDDLSQIEIEENDYVHLSPNTLHRTIAVTDIVMIEISTPYLNDVIRVMDDSNRTHGKIEEEHK
jgi:mannose-6-phosphate isomerase-like protein (cupin superfamily)